MTYTRWGTVIAILFVVGAVTVSAQFGGDPMSNAALSLKSMVTFTLRVLAVVAFMAFGFKWFSGHGSMTDVVGMIIGATFVFGADRVAALLFPGMTP